MKFLKYITPFIWFFPVCLFLSIKTWLGDFYEYNLPPGRAVLFISIGFTMLIVDVFAKYLIGKSKVGVVWLIELILLGVLAAMIVPKVMTLNEQASTWLYPVSRLLLNCCI